MNKKQSVKEEEPYGDLGSLSQKRRRRKHLGQVMMESIVEHDEKSESDHHTEVASRKQNNYSKLLSDSVCSHSLTILARAIFRKQLLVLI